MSAVEYYNDNKPYFRYLDDLVSPPPWFYDALAMLSHKPWRVTAFHLTDGQQQQLEDMTGQKALLLGKPVR